MSTTNHIKTEAHLTTFEAISMIVGNSIGTGIIAAPYLATKNSMLDVVWMVLGCRVDGIDRLLRERDPASDHCRAVLQ